MFSILSDQQLKFWNLLAAPSILLKKSSEGMNNPAIFTNATPIF